MLRHNLFGYLFGFIMYIQLQTFVSKKIIKSSIFITKVWKFNKLSLINSS